MERGNKDMLHVTALELEDVNRPKKITKNCQLNEKRILDKKTPTVLYLNPSVIFSQTMSKSEKVRLKKYSYMLLIQVKQFATVGLSKNIARTGCESNRQKTNNREKE